MDLLYKTGLTGGEALTGLGSMTAMGMLGLQNNIEIQMRTQYDFLPT